jgi:hypothetical protein
MLFVLAAVLMAREPAGAQIMQTSISGVTSGSCASCTPALSQSWRLAPSQADSSGGRHLKRVAGLTVLGAILGAVAGSLHERGGANCSADICGLHESVVNQSALAGALFGTVIGFSVGMVVWGQGSH